MSDVQISVVMGIRNEAGYIVELLGDILAQDLSRDQSELIIADGESSDGTDEIIEQWIERHPDVQATLLHNPKRWQYPGVNMCIRHARGNAVLVLDGHARVPVDFLANNLEALGSSGAGVVGGFWNTRGANSVWGKAIEGALSSWFGVGSAQFRIEGASGPVDVVPFGCFQREVFERVGLYREELGSNADLDIFQRVRQAGFVVYLDPDIVTTYFARPSLRSLARQMFRNGRWFLAHLKATRPRHLAPLLLVLGLVGLPVVALLWPAAIWIWGGMIAAYTLAGLYSAMRMGDRSRNIKIALAVLIVFPVMHISYGVGWLAGLFSRDVWSARVGADARPPQLSGRVPPARSAD